MRRQGSNGGVTIRNRSIIELLLQARPSYENIRRSTLAVKALPDTTRAALQPCKARPPPDLHAQHVQYLRDPSSRLALQEAVRHECSLLATLMSMSGWAELRRQRIGESMDAVARMDASKIEIEQGKPKPTLY